MSPGSQFVGAPHRHFVSFAQAAKNLDGLAVQLASLDIYPLGVSPSNADDERCLCGSRNCRRWNEESGFRPPHGPNNCGKHPRTQAPLGVVDVELDRHGPRLYVHRMSDTGNRPHECLTGEGRNAELDLASDVDTRGIFLWDRNNEPEPSDLFD